MARGLERPPRWAVIVMVLGVAWLVGAGLFLGHRQSSSASSPTFTPTAPTTTAAPAVVTVPQAIRLLAQPARPFTLAVFGDSTGNDPGEWVYLTAQHLSAKYSRPVVIHNWSIDTNSYSGTTTVGSGSNAPITIWNGSASGKTAGYSLEHFEAIAPARPDLAIVNHGHNESTVDQAVTEVSSLLHQIAVAWPSPPAVAVTLENPRLDQYAKRQDQVVAALRARFAALDLIDVYGAFRAAPNLAALVNSTDRYHPNLAGERLWADTVTANLGVK